MREATVFLDYAGDVFTIMYHKERLTDDLRARFAAQVLEAEARTGDLRGAPAGMELAAEIVEAVVVRWNVRDGAAQEVSITREAMKQLPREFPFLVVVTILRHEIAPDWQPTLSA